MATLTIGRDVTYVTPPKGSVSHLSRFTPLMARYKAVQMSRLSHLSRFAAGVCS